jgi:putative oxidoreductase
MRSRPIYDVVALLARCGVGMVFVAHGWQKIQVGITATERNLDAMGAPAPTAAAVYSTFAELLGGAALILGLALPVAGTLLFLDMAGAMAFIHAKHGIFLVHNGKVSNGFELVLSLGLAALIFATGGGGRLTLDHRLFGRARTGRSTAGANGPEPGRTERGGQETVGLEKVGLEKGEPEQHSLERAHPAPAEIGPPAQPTDPAVPAGKTGTGGAPRRRKPGLRRERTVESPPAERSGEHPIPPAGTFVKKPDTDGTPPARPRLAAEMISDTSQDVIVAGKKSDAPSDEDTAPVRNRKKPSKSD